MDEAAAFAAENHCAFMETSALECTGVDEAFTEILAEIKRQFVRIAMERSAGPSGSVDHGDGDDPASRGGEVISVVDPPPRPSPCSC